MEKKKKPASSSAQKGESEPLRVKSEKPVGDGLGPTPMDDIFRIECKKHLEWLIPVLRELFPDLDLDSKEVRITLLANEHPVLMKDTKGNEKVSKRTTDCLLEIMGERYHLECQSTEDGQILIRMLDYDIRIALEHAVYDRKEDRLVIELPRSAMIYLRRGKGKKKKRGKTAKKTFSRVCLTVGEKQFEYEIPVLNVQSYSAEEIFEKKLYLLIPFYFLRFEGHLEEENDFGRALMEMKELAAGMFMAYKTKDLTGSESSFLAACVRMIIQHVMRDQEITRKERMVKTMEEYSIDLDYFDFTNGVSVKEHRKIVDGYVNEVLELRAELAENKAELAEKETELAENKAELAEKETELAENKAELAENKAELADKITELQANKAELTRKEAENAMLTKKLAMMMDRLAEAGIPY